MVYNQLEIHKHIHSFSAIDGNVYLNLMVLRQTLMAEVKSEGWNGIYQTMKPSP